MAKYEKGDIIKNRDYIAKITEVRDDTYGISWEYMPKGERDLNIDMKQHYVDGSYKKANVFGKKCKAY